MAIKTLLLDVYRHATWSSWPGIGGGEACIGALHRTTVHSSRPGSLRKSADGQSGVFDNLFFWLLNLSRP
jgi:hypothetical protein